MLLREAVLLTFCDPLPAQYSRLWHLSTREWQSLLRWLDISGLALYFFDRLIELQLTHLLPRAVMLRLQQNLRDNTARTRAMVNESSAIHSAFQKAGILYATVKGFSLWPDSVPKLELRSQLDLDFMVAEKDISRARQLLEGRGYRLRAISGRSFEFKTDAVPSTSLKELYKDSTHRCVELHMEPEVAGHGSLLACAVRRDFDGISIPVLSPTDLLLGQGLHLYKHVCGEFARTAHLLEFRRNIIAHYEDVHFWRDLQRAAEELPGSPVALGVAILLITHVMGEFAPKALTNWTVSRVPDSARLWIDLYGYRCVLADFPGNKLYLLLQRELASVGVSTRRPLQGALVPLRLPPSLSPAAAGDSVLTLARRSRVQLFYIYVRSRFHLSAGLEYIWELLRWRQRIRKLQTNDNPQTCP